MSEVYAENLAMWQGELDDIARERAVLDQRQEWAERQQRNWIEALGSLAVDREAVVLPFREVSDGGF